MIEKENNEVVVKLKPAFSDDRGVIVNFLEQQLDSFKILGLPADIPSTEIKQVAFIEFKKAGDIRANHYHPNGLDQYVYCVAGSYESFSQKLKVSNGKVEPDGEIQKIIVKAGDLIYTPTMIAHAMKALEPAVIINLNPRTRKEEDYMKGSNPHTILYKLID